MARAGLGETTVFVSGSYLLPSAARSPMARKKEVEVGTEQAEGGTREVERGTEEIERAPRRGTVAASLDAPAADERVGPAPFDAVHVRNYDHRRSYSVTVTVDSAAGARVLSDRFSLDPGGSDRSTAPLPAGEYEVRVDVDGVERVRTTCRLSRSPSGTAVVELGNGAVSVTAGGPARWSGG